MRYFPIKYLCHRGGALNLDKELSFSKGEAFSFFPQVYVRAHVPPESRKQSKNHLLRLIESS